jgi:hypothetical protein
MRCTGELRTVSVAKLEPLKTAQVNEARLAARRALKKTVHQPTEEDSPMSRRFIVAMIGLGLAFAAGFVGC